MRIDILNVPFDDTTLSESLSRVLCFLEQGGNHTVYTPNPEMVMMANEDAGLMEALRKADLVVPDGVGVVWASRVTGRALRERVAGCDLALALFDAVKGTGKSVYLLGGKPGVAELAAKNMGEKYRGLNMTGWHDGYFSREEEPGVLDEIRRLKPDILLVGLGAGKQEKWIFRNRGLPVRLSVGVGGSIDVMAGTVKRAPEIFRRLGLEWFYRLASQPSRWRRMLKLPAFALKVLFESKKEKRSGRP